MNYTKRLYILAPNDRFNYGDLLFPLIVHNELKSLFDEVNYISTTQSDFSAKGGVQTKSIEALYNIDKGDNYLIIAGGESLFVSWGVLASYISSSYDALSYCLNKPLRKVFGEYVALKIQNYLGRKYLKGKTLFPLTIGKYELMNVKKIFYNSLGGTHVLKSVPQILQSKKIISLIKDVDYISVRDKVSYGMLSEINSNSHLTPDCAILISNVYSREWLVSNCSFEIRNKGLSEKGYIFFQINKKLWLRNRYDILRQFDEIYNVHRLPICLCPIGTALGHEDHLALKEIESNIKDKIPCTYIEDPSIWDIMHLISNSCLYIGSSLHGAITAMSYNVPYLGFGPAKLREYLETWGEEGTFSSINELGKCSKTVCDIDKIIFSENLAKQKRISLDSFDNIKRLIRE